MRSTTVAMALAVFALIGCGDSADNPASADHNAVSPATDNVNPSDTEQMTEGIQLVTLRLPGMT
ncbi:MAG: hypothetical protein MK110_05945 [Fuerstiella sp.]|nr:hypothetical protein [Fuerstiella sp.]